MKLRNNSKKRYITENRWDQSDGTIKTDEIEEFSGIIGFP